MFIITTFFSSFFKVIALTPLRIEFPNIVNLNEALSLGAFDECSKCGTVPITSFLLSYNVMAGLRVDSYFQYPELIIKDLGKYINEFKAKLIVIDSIISLHRAEFTGRGTLADR